MLRFQGCTIKEKATNNEVKTSLYNRIIEQNYHCKVQNKGQRSKIQSEISNLRNICGIQRMDGKSNEIDVTCTLNWYNEMWSGCRGKAYHLNMIWQNENKSKE